MLEKQFVENAVNQRNNLDNIKVKNVISRY